jgi:hypothetical protein
MQTNNKAWGFYGTIRHHADSAEAWPLAMLAVADATGWSDAAVRDFLDSRHGRHFADDVANGLVNELEADAAIEAAVTAGWPVLGKWTTRPRLITLNPSAISCGSRIRQTFALSRSKGVDLPPVSTRRSWRSSG